MFTAYQLTETFNQLPIDQQNTIFAEITKNPEAYNRMFPGLPLIQYIMDNNSVPVEQHGPIINRYKEWRSQQA